MTKHSLLAVAAGVLVACTGVGSLDSRPDESTRDMQDPIIQVEELPEQAEETRSEFSSCQNLLDKYEGIVALAYTGEGNFSAKSFGSSYGPKSRLEAKRQLDSAFPFLEDAASALEEASGPFQLDEFKFLSRAYLAARLQHYLYNETIIDIHPTTELSELLLSEDQSDDPYYASIDYWVEYCFEYSNRGNWNTRDYDYQASRVQDKLEAGLAHMLAWKSCNQGGTLPTREGPVDCAGQEGDALDSPSPSCLDPFECPRLDANDQAIAEYAWCFNRGLEVNASRTGCR